MRLKQSSQAGSLESNDVLVLIKPENKGSGIKVEIESIVMNQFGEKIRNVVKKKLKEMSVEDIHIKIQDRGALDCTIEARVEAAITRAQ